MARYSPLPSTDSLLHGFPVQEKGPISTAPARKQSENKRQQWRTLILIACLLASLFANAALWRLRARFDANRFCSRYTSQSISPILDAIEVEYTETAFNGSFWGGSVYRQELGPEVDEAWQALGVEYGPILVSEEDGAKAGLAPGNLKRPPEKGGGYPVAVEGLHHLHCLNLLRQTNHWNYPYYKNLGTGAFTNEEKILRAHADHCLDILRQQLMCTVDVNVFGQVWVDGVGAFPDFMTKHKCKNFDAIRQWVHDQQVDGEDSLQIRPGDIMLPSIP